MATPNPGYQTGATVATDPSVKTTGPSVKTTDLPAGSFPFTIELIHPATRAAVWSVTVDGPGAIKVPAARDLGHARLESRVRFPDGTVTESDRPRQAPLGGR